MHIAKIRSYHEEAARSLRTVEETAVGYNSMESHRPLAVTPVGDCHSLLAGIGETNSTSRQYQDPRVERLQEQQDMRLPPLPDFSNSTMTGQDERFPRAEMVFVMRSPSSSGERSLSSSVASSSSSGDQMSLSYVMNNGSSSPSDNTPSINTPSSSSRTSSYTSTTPNGSTSNQLPALESRCGGCNQYSSLPIRINSSNTFNEPMDWQGTQSTPLISSSNSPGGSWEQRNETHRESIASQPLLPGSYPSSPPEFQRKTTSCENSYPEYCPPPPPPTPTSSEDHDAQFHHHAYPFPNTNSKMATYRYDPCYTAMVYHNRTPPLSPPGSLQPSQVYRQAYTQPHAHPVNLQHVQKTPSAKSSVRTSHSVNIGTSSSIPSSSIETTSCLASSTGTGISTLASPSMSPSPRLPSNSPYTREQIDFFLYARDTLHLSWPKIVQKFRKQFPSRHHATVSALQGRYYRAQPFVSIEEGSWNLGGGGGGGGEGEGKDFGSDGCKEEEKRKGVGTENGEAFVDRDGGTASTGDGIDEGWGREGGLGGEGENRGWQKQVKVRDRQKEGIKALGLKYELVYMKGTDYSPDDLVGEEEDGDAIMDEGRAASEMEMMPASKEKVNTRSGAERLLSYRWSIVKPACRERAAKIIARRNRRKRMSKM